MLSPVQTFALSAIEEYQQNEKAIAELDNNLAETRARKATLAEELSSINSSISQVQARINKIQGDIDKANREISSINQQIAQTEIDLKKQKIIMSEYLRTIYMEGQTSTVELIVKSNSFSEFVDQSEYLNTMQQSVQETAEKILQLKADLVSKKSEAEKTKAIAEELQAEQISRKNTIRAQQNEYNYLMSTTRGSEAAYQSQKNGLLARQGALYCEINDCGTNAAGDLQIINRSPYFNQRDPQWGSYQFAPGVTMSGYGCLITSLAMSKMFYGISTSPLIEAQNRNFTSDGLLYWNDVGGRPRVNVTGNWSAINKALDSGKVVIAQLYMKNSSYPYHWVLLVGKSDGKYYVNDPYFRSGGYDSDNIVTAYTSAY